MVHLNMMYRILTCLVVLNNNMSRKIRVTHESVEGIWVENAYKTLPFIEAGNACIFPSEHGWIVGNRKALAERTQSTFGVCDQIR